MQSLPENAGIEAMLDLSDGPLLLMAEGSQGLANMGQVWIGLGDLDFLMWTKAMVARSDGFAPTSLAESPGRYTILLEHRYTDVDGPAARISRFPSTAGG